MFFIRDSIADVCLFCQRLGNGEQFAVIYLAMHG